MLTWVKLLLNLRKQNKKKMKLQDYMFAITLITIIIFYGIWELKDIDNRQTVWPAEKTYISYGSYDRADTGEITIVNELGKSLYPGNPIQTQWKITNTGKEPWTGWMTVVLDKSDKLLITYVKFVDIRKKFTIDPGETILVDILGFIDPEITLTNLQTKYINKSIIINLALYEDTIFDRLFWNTRSVYYFYEYFDRSTNDFIDRHYIEVPKKCQEVVDTMEKHSYLPWVCSRVKFDKPEHLSKLYFSSMDGAVDTGLSPDDSTSSYYWGAP
jgi:hypothetical protein